MSDEKDSRPQPRRLRLDTAAKAAVVEGLAAGARLRDLAAACGVTTQALYKARSRDPLFEAGWRAAHAASAEAERRAAREARAASVEEAGVGEERIVSNNRRLLQRRRMRHVRFDARRRAAFLAHFGWSCDLGAAAAEAGVCERTVFNHLRGDPAFAAEFQAALEQAYALLEAEAVRERIAAQQTLRAAVAAAGAGSRAGAGPGPAARPYEALGAEFDRVMTLLARWDRRDGSGPGPRTRRPSEAQAWTFEEAIAALDRKLRALGLRREGVRPAADNDEGPESAAG